MKAHLFFVRHAQTVANRDGIRQGVTGDYPLTDLGHQEAEAVGNQLKNQAFDLILCSDLRRTVLVFHILNDG